MDPRRFLFLEKDRGKVDGDADTSNPEERAELKERFCDLEQPASAAVERVPTGLAPERFRDDESSGLGLDVSAGVTLAFIRCVRCRADNSRFVDVCAQCGVSLTTPEQRAFNQELASERSNAALQERQALDALKSERDQQGARQATQLREAQAELGRALALRVRDEMEKQLGGDVEGPSFDPPGVRLLRLIADRGARLAAALAIAALLLAPWLAPRAGFKLRLVSLLTFVVLFAPTSWWRQRKRW
jgi:hypothetical protein